MPMNRNDLLNAIIDDGIEEIRTTYLRPDQRVKRDGGMAGFQACRGKEDGELVFLLGKARAATIDAMERRAADYWGVRMYEVQIEWTLNVLSAAMVAHDMQPITGYTARGMLKAADILGVGATTGPD